MTPTTLLPLGVTAVMLPELDFEDQLDLCRSLGITHYVYRPRLIPEKARDQPYSNWGNHKFDLTPERLKDSGKVLSDRLREAGLQTWGTVPNCDTGTPLDELRLHLEGAAAVGAPNVRINPVRYPQTLFDFRAYLDQVRGQYRDIVAAAKPLRVKIVIEMHGGYASCSPGLLRMIVDEFDPADVGVLLDFANLAIEGFVQPVLTLSVLRDHLDHAHIGGCRRVDGTYDAHGFRRAEFLTCPLTESDLHIPTWLRLLAQIGRPIPLVIEDYTPSMSGAARLTRTARSLKSLLEELDRDA